MLATTFSASPEVTTTPAPADTAGSPAPAPAVVPAAPAPAATNDDYASGQAQLVAGFIQVDALETDSQAMVTAATAAMGG